jgi:hypothetical protein
MNTWIRIVLISALGLMLLGPTALATGTLQENTTWGISGGNDTFQRASQSPDISRNSLMPVPMGGITADSRGTKVPLVMDSGPSVGGVPLFPPDHIWNTRADSLPVDSRSAEYIGTIGSTAYLHADFGSGTWEGNPIGIPYNIVNGSQVKKAVLFDYADESDPGPYPIPDNPLIEGGSDHHMLIIDQDTKRLYELFAAEKQVDGSWTAGSGAVFNLSGYTLRPSGWTSADAAGLAILPGLVRYDEVNAGEINHALRFTAPSTRRAYIWPARHYASSVTDPSFPPMGQRFRLKSSFNISGYPYQAQIVLQALKKYGMILSDNGAPWYITGAPDEQWINDALHTLHQVKGSDFEAVDSSSLMINQDSGQALINPVVIGTSHRIGVYRDGTWYLDTDGSGTWNTGDTCASFGPAGWTAVPGDWNGDNKTEPGAYNNGTWYLDYNGNGAYDGSVVDRTASFGSAGYKPVVGDWDGTGNDKIGVEKDGVWAIDYNGNYVWDGHGPDRFAAFGQPGDIPVIGDWDGNGKDKIGSHKDGFWAVDYNGNYLWDGAVTDRFAGFGLTADIPVIGDWNGDGKDKIGMEINGFWAVDYNGNYVWDGAVTDRFAAFGQSGDTPVVGDWDGNGKTKIGSFKGGFWAIDYNGNYVWNGAVTDRFTGFGQIEDTPVVGNWS